MLQDTGPLRALAMGMTVEKEGQTDNPVTGHASPPKLSSNGAGFEVTMIVPTKATQIGTVRLQEMPTLSPSGRPLWSEPSAERRRRTH